MLFAEYDNIDTKKKEGDAMFRKRRRHHSFGNLLGLIFIVVGVIVLIYAIPFKFWVFILGFGCFIIGIIISKF